jgi:methyladenine glycosylase
MGEAGHWPGTTVYVIGRLDGTGEIASDKRKVNPRRDWLPAANYAFMQSIGLVNDHIVGCFRRGLNEKSDSS